MIMKIKAIVAYFTVWKRVSVMCSVGSRFDTRTLDHGKQWILWKLATCMVIRHFLINQA